MLKSNLPAELTEFQDLIKSYDNPIYEKEIRLVEAIVPFVKPETQKLLKTLSDFYYFKGIVETFKPL